MTHVLPFVKTIIIENNRRDLDEAFEFHVSVSITTKFVYNTATKKIYELINNHYKLIQHEEIMFQHNILKDNEKYCHKLEIDFEYGRYKSFKPYMGIKWLSASEIYNAIPKRLNELKPLSKQDLDRIEKYVNIEVERFVRKSIELGRVYGLDDEIKLLKLKENKNYNKYIKK